MASIVGFDESESFDFHRTTDDIRQIVKDCSTVEDWQSQLILSLKLSGWTPGMLLFLPCPSPIHWVLILQHEGMSLINERTQLTNTAHRLCGVDRPLWFALSCKALKARGWTPTMLGHAFQIPKTNIYRALAVDLSGSDTSDDSHGKSTKTKEVSTTSEAN